MLHASFDRKTGGAAFWAILFFFAAHAYTFLNSLFSGESVMISLHLNRALLMIRGRYLLPVYGRLRGDLAAPLLVGVLSCLYLTACAAWITDLLGIRGRFSLPIACGLLVANAAVTSENLSELYIADAGYLALLLGVLAVTCCLRTRRGFWAAPPLIFLSLALDQAAFPAICALALSGLLLAKLDSPQRDATALKRCSLKLSLAILCGALLHAVLYPLMLARSNLTPEPGAFALASMDAFSSPAAMIKAALISIARLVHPDTYHPLLCGVLTALLLLAGLAALIALLRRQRGIGLFACILLALLVPFAANLNGFDMLSPARGTYAFFLIPVLALALLDRAAANLPAATGLTPTRLKACAAALCCVPLLNSIIFANQLYLKRHLEQQSTLSVMTRIVARAEAVPGFMPGFTPVAIIGDLDTSALSVPRAGFEHLAAFDSGNYAVSTEKDNIWYFWQILGYPFGFVSDFEREQLAEDPRVQALPLFPAQGCCEMIDGTLVIRLT